MSASHPIKDAKANANGAPALDDTLCGLWAGLPIVSATARHKSAQSELFYTGMPLRLCPIALLARSRNERAAYKPENKEENQAI
jgi:hypothetical protein